MSLDHDIKMKHGAEFRRCLIDLDVQGMMRLSAETAPHLAKADEKGTLYAMHLARTEMQTIPIGLKIYSQRWLNERGYGSFAPDDKRGH